MAVSHLDSLIIRVPAAGLRHSSSATLQLGFKTAIIDAPIWAHLLNWASIPPIALLLSSRDRPLHAARQGIWVEADTSGYDPKVGGVSAHARGEALIRRLPGLLI